MFETKPNDGAFSIEGEQLGLTKREYFAIHILQGLASNPDPQVATAGAKQRVIWAIEEADLLIYQLGK